MTTQDDIATVRASLMDDQVDEEALAALDRLTSRLARMEELVLSELAHPAALPRGTSDDRCRRQGMVFAPPSPPPSPTRRARVSRVATTGPVAWLLMDGDRVAGAVYLTEAKAQAAVRDLRHTAPNRDYRVLPVIPARRLAP